MKASLFTLAVVLLAALATPAQAQQVAPNSTASSSIATNAWVARAGSARVYDIFVHNNSASDLWCQVFDSATNQLDGARSTIPPVLIVAGEGGGFAWSSGRPFRTGVFVATSTTDQTLTNGSANFKIDVVYRDNN